MGPGATRKNRAAHPGEPGSRGGFANAGRRGQGDELEETRIETVLTAHRLPAPGELSLGKGEAHVWSVPLDLPAVSLARVSRCLSAGERRAFGAGRRSGAVVRRAAARGILRHLLAGYTGLAPEEVRIASGPRGAPGLTVPPGVRAGPGFGVAHSGQRALLAFAPGTRPGVDLELLHPVADRASLAGRCLLPAERRAVERAAPAGRDRAFLRLWTAKEAVLKATGAGLAIPPRRVRVDLGPPPRAWLSSAAGAAAEWWLRLLEPEPGYIGSLALPAGRWGLSLRALSLGALSPEAVSSGAPAVSPGAPVAAVRPPGALFPGVAPAGAARRWDG